MKKQKLAVCVLSAALMIGAATLTSYAAEGWQQSGSSWIYVDNNGNKVTNTWKKGADNLWRYLDSQGNIASNCWVDDEYFVESTGIMATDKWLKLPKRNPAWNETSATTVWYYFSTSGKMVSDGWSKIGGKYYYFDGDGAMQTGWVDMGNSSGFANYRYYQSNGQVQTGWLSTTPPEDDDYNLDLGSDVQWYYFSSNGEPKVGPKISDASTSNLVRINNITYLFNEKGNPVYGLRRLEVGTSGQYACYFFGADKATSSVVKGKGNVVEGDGTTGQFYFADSGNKAGRGYSGVEDGFLYYMGKLQKADSGTKYEVIEVNDKNYLVTTSGKVVKSSTVKDANGTKFKTSSAGVVTEVDGTSDDGSDEARTPVEPTYWED